MNYKEYFFVVSFFLFSVPLVAVAFAPGTPQGGGTGPGTPQQQGTTLINPLSGNCTANQNCLQTLLQSILAFVIKIGTVVIVLMLVYIGYLFATTSIQPENKQKAKDALLWTIIGALILLGAQAIALGIQATVDALSVGT